MAEDAWKEDELVILSSWTPPPEEREEIELYQETARGEKRKLSPDSEEASKPVKEKTSPVAGIAKIGDPSPLPQPQAEEASTQIMDKFCSKQAPGKEKESTLRVTTNMWKLYVEETGPYFRYAVRVAELGGPRPKELSKGAGDDFYRQKKRQGCWAALQAVAAENPDVFGEQKYALLYDRAAVLFSRSDLLGDKLSEKFVTALEGQAVELELQVVTGTAEPSLGVDQFLATLTELPLEILTSQKIYADGKFVGFGRSFYRRAADGQRKELGGGRELADGFSKHVRPVQGEKGGSGPHPALEIDLKKTAFYKAQGLVEHAAEVLSSGRRGQAPDLQRRLSPAQMAVLERSLRDMQVLTTYGKKGRAITVAGLKDSADMETMTLEREGEPSRTMTIAEYFDQKIGIRLQFPSLPCVSQRTPRGQNLFPMELLEVAPNQRVALKKQTEEQMRNMIKESAVPPARRLQELKTLMGASKVEDNGYLDAWGVRVSGRQMKTQARVLPKPTIQYAGKTTARPQPGRSGWEKPARAGWLLGGVSERWAVLCFERARLQDIEGFINRFSHKAGELGTRMEPRPYNVQEGLRMEDISPVFRASAQNGVDFILCVTPNEKPKELHDALKLAEREFEITQQSVVFQTALSIARPQNPRRAEGTLVNILAKTNQKLGGLNYEPSVAPEYAGWFRPGVMYVGLDVNHPPPPSALERRLGGSSEPSVVGCAWNTFNEPFLYQGDYRFQQGRMEEVGDLETLMTTALRSYSEGKPDQLPRSILVFRDGVSDGQFQMVLDSEGAEIKAAMAKVGGANYAGKLTQVVVMKRHNTRFFRCELNASAKPMDQNIPSGTVVDREVVHAKFWEFFLNSHTAIQGTAKTPRYVVLRDENGMSSDEMQNVAFTLSFGHQIVSLAVSIPAPVYAAHNLAKRGKRLYSAQERRDGGAEVGALIRDFNSNLTIAGTRMAGKTFWA